MNPEPSAVSPLPGAASTASAASTISVGPPASVPAAGHQPRRKLPWVVGALLAIVSLFFIVPAAWRAWTTESTDDAYVNGHVTLVAPRVGGQVVQVLVDDNNRVRKSDLLVQLDKQPYEIAVRLSQAAVDNAQANLALTDDQLRATVAQARGHRYALEHAMEDVRNQMALLHSRVAELKVAEANLVLAEADYARGELLIKSNAISRQEFDQFKAKLDVGKNQVSAAENAIHQVRAGLGLSENKKNPLDAPKNLDQNFSSVRRALAALLESAAPLGIYPESYNAGPQEVIAEFYRRDPQGNLDRIYADLIRKAPAAKQAQAKLDQTRADLDQARLNLKWCDVLAEIDGVVTRRNVNPGNNVQAGQNLMAIRSLTEIWIDANFKETQLEEMRIGQRAQIFVDLYGKRQVFEGRISGFTMGTGSTLALLPPQNATGNFVKVVQRLPVRIELTDYNPETTPLFIGLSVVPYIYIREPALGPDAGKVLQPPLFSANDAGGADSPSAAETPTVTQPPAPRQESP